MRFELAILDREGPMQQSTDVRRNPDGSIDFDYYRRRAARERRLAQRIWLKRNISAVAALLTGVAAGIERALGKGRKPKQPCCSPRERQACCA